MNNILDPEDKNVKNSSISPSQRIELTPRVTLIKQDHKTVNCENININIYYGNYITPPINGKYQSLPDEKYKRTLEDFLNSNEGIRFKHPTEQEIDRVSKETKKYIEELKVKENVKPEQTPVKQNKQEPQQDTAIKKQQGEQPKQEPASVAEQTKPEPVPEKPVVLASDIKSTKEDVYLEAIREETLKSQEAELKEKAEQIKKDREQRQRIQKLEQELEAEKKKANKSVEKLTRKVLIQNEDKDIAIDRALLKIVSICLILSTVMMGILIFLYNIR